MGEAYLNRERVRQNREESFGHLSGEYGATISRPSGFIGQKKLQKHDSDDSRSQAERRVQDLLGQRNGSAL